MITDKEIEKKIFDITDECNSLYSKGDIEGAFNILGMAWNLLPEPKLNQSMSYIVLQFFFDLCIKCKKFELANQWISLIFVSALERVDDGHREFIAGRLAFEQGNLEIAKELFIIANIKSEGVVFRRKERKKYRELLK